MSDLFESKILKHIEKSRIIAVLVIDRIEDLAPGGGFIFTPVHSIQSDVPPENFAAMMETFYSYASY